MCTFPFAPLLSAVSGLNPPAKGEEGTLSEVQVRIVRAVRDVPGLTQKQLARLMGVPTSTLRYQLTGLAERGSVRSERRGRNVRYFPMRAVDPGANPNAPVAATGGNAKPSRSAGPTR